MSAPALSRRHFTALAAASAAAAALPRARAQQPVSATLTFDPAHTLHTVPADYTGLSYESAQLANPAFFSAESKQLIALFRELSPSGVLRIGGGSSEFTTYTDAPPSGPPPFEVFGPDTSHTVKHGTITSALALRNLRAFLEATNWRCLYGLNLGQGTKENAAAEAEAAVRILGPRLVALQIGNEPDSFRNRYRPASYGPADFMAEWNVFHDAIVARLRAANLHANFAGPDISNKLTYLTAFAQEAPRHPDVTMLTGHYYAMGPAGNPDATLVNMLMPDPRLTTIKQRDMHLITEAMGMAKLPFRMSEGNSCWNGGQAGASDTFASALWCADTMLRFAALGFSGVNLHGGGNGIYSPIVGAPSTGFTRRPEFFGMLFAQHFAGATLIQSHLNTPDDRVTAYVASQSGFDLIATVNKTDSDVSLSLDAPWQRSRFRREITLSAPALDATEARLENSHSTHAAFPRFPLRVDPHSALILQKD